MGERLVAAKIAQEEVKRTAGGLARSLAGAREGRVGAICSLLGWPLCTPFLLSQEGESKRLTRPKILEHEAGGRRPKRQDKGGVGSEPCRQWQSGDSRETEV